MSFTDSTVEMETASRPLQDGSRAGPSVAVFAGGDVGRGFEQAAPPGVCWWRKMPTAWIHFFWVECLHIYTALYAWLRLLNQINTKTALPAIFKGPEKVEAYFQQLFFWGHAESVTITLNNVTDAGTYFIGSDSEPILYNGTALTLPATNLDGTANQIWLVIAWILPIGFVFLALFILVSFVPKCFYSFEDGRYVHFTWHLPKHPVWIWSVRLMACGPAILPPIWIIQIIMFQLQEQWFVLRNSAVSGIILLFSLDKLCRVPAVHYWHKIEDFQKLKFKRPFLHLVFSNNHSFGLRLIDAVFTASRGDTSRLDRYLPDSSKADEVIKIFERAVDEEVKFKRENREREQRSAASGDAAA